MAQHFFWGFLYWAKTGKRSYGYIFSKRDYYHALEKYKQKQKLKFEMKEMHEGAKDC